MNFALSDEQELLREAATTALQRVDTLGALRAELDQPGSLPDLWPAAIDAGWPGLLIAEERGGAGLGAFEAMLIAEQCGRTLAATPLLGAWPASALLDAAADESCPAVAEGELRAAWLPARPPAADGTDGTDGTWTVDRPRGHGRAPLPQAAIDGDALTLTGTVAFVPDAAGAELLVAIGWDGEGGDDDAPAAAVLDATAAGVTIEPVRRYDASRALAHVTLDNARGRRLAIDPDALARAWHLAQALLASEALGAAGACLEMATEYARQRFTFGRPIGSYQGIKHPLTEVLRQLENSRSLQYWAGWAWESQPDEFALATGALRTAADSALELANTTNIVTHGGIGVTWEHDAPLFFRRATLQPLLLGGTQAATDAFATELIARGRVPVHG
jgi:alkylation response protein AidB-like acyl-CoA dehydrogenase